MSVRYLSALEGSNKAMQELMGMVMVCAKSDASVLIQGETGAGKDVICREMHRLSGRADKPLVAVNCAAIPSQLLESELFGYRKGAFTGATSDRPGRLERANKGTLFLDEIGDMPLELQVKLLRVLEERVVEPLGGDPTPIDVRIVAATHRNLKEMVAKGTFREDLYYRLNVVSLRVPALRERTEDIPAFCRHFAESYAGDAEPVSLTPRSLALLRQHSWPGNVRELANLMMRLNVLFPGEKVDLMDIPRCTLPEGLLNLVEQHEPLLVPESQTCTERPEATTAVPLFCGCGAGEAGINNVEAVLRLANGVSSLPSEGIAARRILQSLEKSFIKAALSQANGNVSKAANLLQLQRTTLIQKISKYDISDSGFGFHMSSDL